jgi:hypothetical protein
MTDGGNTLARMVMVDVTWQRWRPEGDLDHYQAILGQLTGPPPGSGPYGPAYVHQCDERPPDQCQRPGEWREGLPGQRWALAALDQQAAAERDRVASNRREPDQHRRFRTRVAMAADRFRATAGCGGTVGYWVLIDLRFQRVSADVTLWHTSFSVWSDRPWSDHHCPPLAGARPEHTLTAAGLHDLLDDYTTNSRPAFRDLIGDRHRDTLPVFGRRNEPPGFLVADGEPEIMRTAAQAIVQTQDYQALPRAQVKGGVEVFRRLLAAGDRDRPRYLLIPDTQVSTRTARPARRHQLQEEAAAAGIQALTDLEAYAVTELGDIDSQLDARENHLRLYQAAAGQAGVLWAALARLLPGSGRDDLEIVQRAIELIHQTLLQGVAALDQMTRDIDSVLSRIEVTADEISGRFDRELGQPEAHRAETLRRSLHGESIDRLRRHGRDLPGTAARVTDSYRMLLETIGLAFDESSAREGDRMQKAAMWLAVGFGILGLSGVAQATAPLPSIQQTWQVWLIRSAVWLVTLAVAAFTIWRLAQPWYSVRRITQAFAQRYRSVRDFLAAASTDRLNHFRHTHSPADPGQAVAWQRLDDELSGQFLQAWRQADAAQNEVRPESYDPRALRTRVEAWTLRTLLLTERPRDFDPYRLPVLTVLYRLCSARELRDWPTAWETTDADSAVGLGELRRVLDRCGLTEPARPLIDDEPDLLELTPEDLYAQVRTTFGYRQAG